MHAKKKKIASPAHKMLAPINKIPDDALPKIAKKLPLINPPTKQPTREANTAHSEIIPAQIEA